MLAVVVTGLVISGVVHTPGDEWRESALPTDARGGGGWGRQRKRGMSIIYLLYISGGVARIDAFLAGMRNGRAKCLWKVAVKIFGFCRVRNGVAQRADVGFAQRTLRRHL